MIDDNWELINGDEAHAIEVLNYANQINVIEALIRLLMHHNTAVDGSCAVSPNDRTLKEFHRTATLFLLHLPGEYRNEDVVVRTNSGIIVHSPPPYQEVEKHMGDFFTMLARRWTIGGPQEVAAYCLWMINWVHPFKNGNGRTARAFCYACLSLKLGFVLPGAPTIIDSVMSNRDRYQNALKKADREFEISGEPDLQDMIDFIDELLALQLANV